MSKAIDKEIEGLSTPWENYSGTRVEEFIKKWLGNAARVFHYDTSNNRYMVFASEANRDSYLENPEANGDLLIAVFDAPFNYSAEINLVTPSYTAILSGATGNYLEFSFDTKNKQGQSVGEDVICTYTFTRGSVKQTLIQRCRYGTQVRLNVDSYLGEGTNRITIGISGQQTLAATTTAVTFQVVNLKLSSNLDISKVYDTTTPAEVPYTVEGNGLKMMEWYLDGEKLEYSKDDDEITEISSSRIKYISLAALSEGRHDIQARASVVLEGERFYSQLIYRDILIYKNESYGDTYMGVAMDIADSSGPVESGHPSVYGQEYETMSLQIAAFNSRGAANEITVICGDVEVGSLTVPNRQQGEFRFLPPATGSQQIILTSGNCTYTIDATITPSTLALAEITSGIELDLSAVGKSNSSVDREVWRFGDYKATFSGVQWNDNSGWVNDRLLLSRGGAVDINLAPLAKNPAITGKTLEMEFSTRDVTDDNAVVMDLRNADGTGLLVTASQVLLTSSGGVRVSNSFMAGTDVRISVVINPNSGTTNKCLAFIYVDGILSNSAGFAVTDSFASSTAVRVASSDSVSVELKQLRFYNMALSSDQILNNYCLYRDSVDELRRIYDRNDIYEEGTQSFSPDKISSQLPVMILTGNVPALEATTDKNLQIDVDIDYTNLQNPALSFSMKQAALRPQGTSSMSYPKKNFRFYTQKNGKTVVLDSGGNRVESNLYSFQIGAQPVNCWCLKADYAESSGTHNTGIARLWNDAMKNAVIDGEYKLRTAAQLAAASEGYQYDVRTTVDGFPIALFYRIDENSPLVFLGKYNFNNDKSTESVFGFCDIPGFDSSNVECWETLSNGNHLALFEDIDNWDAEWPDAFEARYPDGNKDTANLKTFASWIASTKNDIAKFAAEKWEHLDVYKVAAYYVYLMRFGAVDQPVKNSMLQTEDGAHWFFINYDNDTVLGLRNDGRLIYSPYIDRQSTDDSYSSTVYAYAGHDSTLWNNLEADEEFMSIVRDVDQALYVAGLSYENVIDILNEQQAARWCERIYNQDAQYKYIGPFVNSGVNNLFMLQGSRKSHRSWWLSKRFNLYDSKFVSGAYKANVFEIKVAGAPAGIDFSITAGAPLSYGYGVNNVAVSYGVELDAGEAHTFSTQQTLNVGDPLRIYAATNLEEVDVHNFISYLSTVYMDKVNAPVLGTNLKRLIIGVDISADTRRNNSLHEISGLSSAKKLELLDIGGYQGITSIDLSALSNLNTLKAKGSGLTSVSFADGAPLRRVELPATLQALSMSNVSLALSSLEIESTENLTNLSIRNCPGICSNYNFFYNWYQNLSPEKASMASLTVHGVNWNALTAQDLLNLHALADAGGLLELKGEATLASVSQDEVDALSEAFGAECFSNTSEFRIKAPEGVFLTGPAEVLEGDKAKYVAAVFSSKSGYVTYRLADGNTDSQSIDADTGYLTTKETGSVRTITVIASFHADDGDITNKRMTVTIQKRSYPSITIDGPAIVKSEAEYTLLYSGESNGIYGIVWEISGTAVDAGIVSIKEQTDSHCVVAVGEFTDEYSFTLNAKLVKSFDNSVSSESSVTVDVDAGDYVMTSAANPKAMAVCYAKGWCAKRNKMTRQECAAVEDVGTEFNSLAGEDFDAFQYFVGLTSLVASAFGYYTSNAPGCLTLPKNILQIGTSSDGSGSLNAQTRLRITSPELKSYCSIGAPLIEFAEGMEVLEVKDIQGVGVKQLPASLKKLIITEISRSKIAINSNLEEGSCITVKSSSNDGDITLGPDVTAVPENFILSSGYSYKLKKLSVQSEELTITQKCLNNISALDLGNAKIKFADYVVSTSEYPFRYSTFVNKTIHIHPDVTDIPTYAFYASTGFETVDFANVLSIGGQAFANIHSLKTIIFPSTLTSIGFAAFDTCSGLTEVRFAAGITSIPAQAFYHCTSLATITLSEGLTSIERYAFGYCSSLPGIALPSTLTSIDERAFENCIALLEVIIPQNVTRLGGNVFGGCTALRRVEIPAGLNNWGGTVFNNCTALREVVLHEGLKTLGSQAFCRCTSLEEIVLPSTLTRLGPQLFDSCSGLKTIVCTAVTPPTGSLASNTLSLEAIYVPDESVDAYKAASAWKTYASVIKPLSSKPEHAEPLPE